MAEINQITSNCNRYTNCNNAEQPQPSTSEAFRSIQNMYVPNRSDEDFYSYSSRNVNTNSNISTQDIENRLALSKRKINQPQQLQHFQENNQPQRQVQYSPHYLVQSQIQPYHPQNEHPQQNFQFIQSGSQPIINQPMSVEEYRYNEPISHRYNPFNVITAHQREKLQNLFAQKQFENRRQLEMSFSHPHPHENEQEYLRQQMYFYEKQAQQQLASMQNVQQNQLYPGYHYRPTVNLRPPYINRPFNDDEIRSNEQRKQTYSQLEVHRMDPHNIPGRQIMLSSNSPEQYLRFRETQPIVNQTQSLNQDPQLQTANPTANSTVNPEHSSTPKKAKRQAKTTKSSNKPRGRPRKSSLNPPERPSALPFENLSNNSDMLTPQHENKSPPFVENVYNASSSISRNNNQISINQNVMNKNVISTSNNEPNNLVAPVEDVSSSLHNEPICQYFTERCVNHAIMFPEVQFCPIKIWARMLQHEVYKYFDGLLQMIEFRNMIWLEKMSNNDYSHELSDIMLTGNDSIEVSEVDIEAVMDLSNRNSVNDNSNENNLSVTREQNNETNASPIINDSPLQLDKNLKCMSTKILPTIEVENVENTEKTIEKEIEIKRFFCDRNTFPTVTSTNFSSYPEYQYIFENNRDDDDKPIDYVIRNKQSKSDDGEILPNNKKNKIYYENPESVVINLSYRKDNEAGIVTDVNVNNHEDLLEAVTETEKDKDVSYEYEGIDTNVADIEVICAPESIIQDYSVDDTEASIENDQGIFNHKMAENEIIPNTTEDMYEEAIASEVNTESEIGKSEVDVDSFEDVPEPTIAAFEVNDGTEVTITESKNDENVVTYFTSDAHEPVVQETETNIENNEDEPDNSVCENTTIISNNVEDLCEYAAESEVDIQRAIILENPKDKLEIETAESDINIKNEDMYETDSETEINNENNDEDASETSVNIINNEDVYEKIMMDNDDMTSGHEEYSEDATREQNEDLFENAAAESEVDIQRALILENPKDIFETNNESEMNGENNDKADEPSNAYPETSVNIINNEDCEERVNTNEEENEDNEYVDLKQELDEEDDYNDVKEEPMFSESNEDADIVNKETHTGSKINNNNGTSQPNAEEYTITECVASDDSCESDNCDESTSTKKRVPKIIIKRNASNKKTSATNENSAADCDSDCDSLVIDDILRETETNSAIPDDDDNNNDETFNQNNEPYWLLKIDSKLKCLHCSFKHEQYEDVLEHIKTQHAIYGTYSCIYCTVYKSNFEDFIDHMMKEHNHKDMLRKCNFCNEVFEANVDFIMHLQKTHQTKWWSCKFCPFISKFQIETANHVCKK